LDKNLQKALQTHQKSLEIYREIGDKSGIAESLNCIGGILEEQGNFQEAFRNLLETLEIYKTLSDRSGVAVTLCNMGHILRKQGRRDEALEKLNQSINIQEDIGDRTWTADTYNIIGMIYNEKENDFSALLNLFKSKAVQNQTGIQRQDTIDCIEDIRKKLGIQRFVKIASKVFKQLPEEFKTSVNLAKFIPEEELLTPFRRTQPKINRNAPCPCGSGKKYKKCCGKQE
jgi:tetratricopeptide (TPR) repeat protein